MKALVKSRPEQGVWMEDVAVPEIGINDVLIKIHKAAICGTDIHIFNWDEWSRKTIPTPMAIGHEFVGEIADIGPGVRGFAIGDRVTAEGHVNCGICRNCRAGKRHLCAEAVGIGGGRDGAFAEYVVVSAGNVYPKESKPTFAHVASLLSPCQ